MLSGDEEEIEMRDQEDDDEIHQAESLIVPPETKNAESEKVGLNE